MIFLWCSHSNQYWRTETIRSTIHIISHIYYIHTYLWSSFFWRSKTIRSMIRSLKTVAKTQAVGLLERLCARDLQQNATWRSSREEQLWVAQTYRMCTYIYIYIIYIHYIIYIYIHNIYSIYIHNICSIFSIYIYITHIYIVYIHIHNIYSIYIYMYIIYTVYIYT